jgi:hypothetical protein
MGLYSVSITTVGLGFALGPKPVGGLQFLCGGGGFALVDRLGKPMLKRGAVVASGDKARRPASATREMGVCGGDLVGIRGRQRENPYAALP